MTKAVLRRARAVTLTLTVGVALAAGCTRSNPSTPDDPTVDRSDGALPSVRAKRVNRGAITLDGVLDEPAWRSTESTGRFVNPGGGAPESGSRVQGAARLLWSDEGLYLGVTVYDSDPVQGFGASPPTPDPHVWERSSAVELMLQPGDPGDNRDYFEIQLDTAGALWDTRFDDYNRPVGPGPDGQTRFGHQEWVSNLRHGVRIDRGRGRYTMEWLLPWASITQVRAPVPPRVNDTWRMNLYSFRDGQRDSLAWSPLRGQGNFHRSSRFGTLVFVE